MQENRKPIPEKLKRELRQEAYFGCVKCGNPIIDYHHIVPWSKVKKHEKNNLVVLCPNCHREANNGMYDADKVREDKKNPYNKRYRCIVSNLILRKFDSLNLIMGGMTFKSVPIPLTIKGINTIFFNIDSNGRALLNACFFDDKMNIIACIKDNEWKTYIPEDMWDIKYSPGHLKINLKRNKIFLELQVRGNDVYIKTHQIIYGNKITVKDDELIINNNHYINCSITSDYGGILID